MYGVVVDLKELMEGKAVLREISSSPPPVDTAKLAEEALYDPSALKVQKMHPAGCLPKAKSEARGKPKKTAKK
jgi:hypothetical protein